VSGRASCAAFCLGVLPRASSHRWRRVDGKEARRVTALWGNLGSCSCVCRAVSVRRGALPGSQARAHDVVSQANPFAVNPGYGQQAATYGAAPNPFGVAMQPYATAPAAANPFGGGANPYGAPAANPFGATTQPFGAAPASNPFGGAPTSAPYGAAPAATGGGGGLPGMLQPGEAPPELGRNPGNPKEPMQGGKFGSKHVSFKPWYLKHGEDFQTITTWDDFCTKSLEELRAEDLGWIQPYVAVPSGIPGGPPVKAPPPAGGAAPPTVGGVAPPGGNPFGAPAASMGYPAASAANPFGAPASGAANPFGAPASGAANPFAAATTGYPAASAANPFGAAPGGANPFAAATTGYPAASAANPFGAAPGGANPFAAATTGYPAASAANPFGAPASGAANPFAAATTGYPAVSAANPFGAAPGGANPFAAATTGYPAVSAANPFGAATAGYPVPGSVNPYAVVASTMAMVAMPYVQMQPTAWPPAGAVMPSTNQPTQQQIVAMDPFGVQEMSKSRAAVSKSESVSATKSPVHKPASTVAAATLKLDEVEQSDALPRRAAYDSASTYLNNMQSRLGANTSVARLSSSMKRRLGSSSMSIALSTRGPSDSKMRMSSLGASAASLDGSFMTGTPLRANSGGGRVATPDVLLSGSRGMFRSPGMEAEELGDDFVAMSAVTGLPPDDTEGSLATMAKEAVEWLTFVEGADGHPVLASHSVERGGGKPHVAWAGRIDSRLVGLMPLGVTPPHSSLGVRVVFPEDAGLVGWKPHGHVDRVVAVDLEVDAPTGMLSHGKDATVQDVLQEALCVWKTWADEADRNRTSLHQRLVADTAAAEVDAEDVSAVQAAKDAVESVKHTSAVLGVDIMEGKGFADDSDVWCHPEDPTSFVIGTDAQDLESALPLHSVKARAVEDWIARCKHKAASSAGTRPLVLYVRVAPTDADISVSEALEATAGPEEEGDEEMELARWTAPAEVVREWAAYQQERRRRRNERSVRERKWGVAETLADLPQLPKLPDPTLLSDDGSPPLVVKPSLTKLMNMNARELSAVAGFTVERPTRGRIEWLEPVDLRGMDVNRAVTIESGYAIVDAPATAEARAGLNKPCRVTLHGITGTMIGEGEVTEAALRDACDAAGSKFLSILPDSRATSVLHEHAYSWTFEVSHWSGYGLASRAHEARRRHEERTRQLLAQRMEANSESSDGEEGSGDESESMQVESLEDAVLTELTDHSLPKKSKAAHSPDHLAVSGRTSTSGESIEEANSELDNSEDDAGGSEDHSTVSAEDDSSPPQEHPEVDEDDTSVWESPPTRVPLRIPRLAPVLHLPHEERSGATLGHLRETDRAIRAVKDELQALSGSSEIPVAGLDSGVPVDALLALGRTFRVGWGLRGVIVHPARPCSAGARATHDPARHEAAARVTMERVPSTDDHEASSRCIRALLLHSRDGDPPLTDEAEFPRVWCAPGETERECSEQLVSQVARLVDVLDGLVKEAEEATSASFARVAASCPSLSAADVSSTSQVRAAGWRAARHRHARRVFSMVRALFLPAPEGADPPLWRRHQVLQVFQSWSETLLGRDSELELQTGHAYALKAQHILQALEAASTHGMRPPEQTPGTALTIVPGGPPVGLWATVRRKVALGRPDVAADVAAWKSAGLAQLSSLLAQCAVSPVSMRLAQDQVRLWQSQGLLPPTTADLHRYAQDFVESPVTDAELSNLGLTVPPSVLEDASPHVKLLSLGRTLGCDVSGACKAVQAVSDLMQHSAAAAASGGVELETAEREMEEKMHWLKVELDRALERLGLEMERSEVVPPSPLVPPLARGQVPRSVAWSLATASGMVDHECAQGASLPWPSAFLVRLLYQAIAETEATASPPTAVTTASQWLACQTGARSLSVQAAFVRFAIAVRGCTAPVPHPWHLIERSTQDRVVGVTSRVMPDGSEVGTGHQLAHRPMTLDQEALSMQCPGHAAFAPHALCGLAEEGGEDPDAPALPLMQVDYARRAGEACETDVLMEVPVDISVRDASGLAMSESSVAMRDAVFHLLRLYSSNAHPAVAGVGRDAPDARVPSLGAPNVAAMFEADSHSSSALDSIVPFILLLLLKRAGALVSPATFRRLVQTEALTTAARAGRDVPSPEDVREAESLLAPPVPHAIAEATTRAAAWQLEAEGCWTEATAVVLLAAAPVHGTRHSDVDVQELLDANPGMKGHPSVEQHVPGVGGFTKVSAARMAQEIIERNVPLVTGSRFPDSLLSFITSLRIPEHWVYGAAARRLLAVGAAFASPLEESSLFLSLVHCASRSQSDTLIRDCHSIIVALGIPQLLLPRLLARQAWLHSLGSSRTSTKIVSPSKRSRGASSEDVGGAIEYDVPCLIPDSEDHPLSTMIGHLRHMRRHAEVRFAGEWHKGGEALLTAMDALDNAARVVAKATHGVRQLRSVSSAHWDVAASHSECTEALRGLESFPLALEGLASSVAPPWRASVSHRATLSAACSALLAETSLLVERLALLASDLDHLTSGGERMGTASLDQELHQIARSVFV
jgi:hypothetical protein